MKRSLLQYLLLVYLAFPQWLMSQEAESKEEAAQPRHSVAVVLGHAHVFQGRDENGGKKSLSLPVWGIDYNYHFNRRWALGLQTDIIVEDFVVEKYDGEDIERSYPVVPALVVIFTPHRHWGFLLGAGIEIEKEESFFLVRAGVEYSGELPKEWEVFGKIGYDLKWDAYDTGPSALA